MTWNKLIEATMRAPDVVPKGWLTAGEVSKKIGRGKASTHGIITEAIRLGIIETKTWTLKTGGRLMPIPHYRIK